MSLFSVPPLSISLPDLEPSPDPLPPTETTRFTAPPISISLPDPPPTTTVRSTPSTTRPPTNSTPTTTVSPTTTPTASTESPTLSSSASSSTSSTHSSSSHHSTELSTSPESSPPSNVQTNDHSSHTTTLTLTPTGQLSPSDGTNVGFLDNKGATAGVFSVVGIITVALMMGIAVLLVRRRKRKQFDLEHVEAMVGYAPRAPIDGDDDEYPSSHSQTNNTFMHSKTSGSEEMISALPYPVMREQRQTDLPPIPVFLPSHTAHDYRPHEEYNPYREAQGPFVDRYNIQANLNQNKPLPQAQPDTQSTGRDEEHENGSEESEFLEPPSPWPRLGQLPPAFGSPGSEVSLDFPHRKTLRVTNGVDESLA